MKCNKRMLSLLCAAALSLTALPSAIPNDIDVVASDDTILYEFEDGVLSNCEYGVLQWTQIDEDALGNVCDTTGWSGDGFVCAKCRRNPPCLPCAETDRGKAFCPHV